MKHRQSKALTNYGTYWAAALGTLVCLPVLEKPLCHKHFSMMVGGAIVFAGFPSYFAAYWEKGVLWKQWERNTSCRCYQQRAISQIQGWKSFPSPPVLLIKDELFVMLQNICDVLTLLFCWTFVIHTSSWLSWLIFGFWFDHQCQHWWPYLMLLLFFLPGVL